MKLMNDIRNQFFVETEENFTHNFRFVNILKFSQRGAKANTV